MSELQEMFYVNDDGQVEINFDSLELVTSKEFVQEIKFSLFGEKILDFRIDSLLEDSLNINCKTAFAIYSFNWFGDDIYNVNTVSLDIIYDFILEEGVRNE